MGDDLVDNVSSEIDHCLASDLYDNLATVRSAGGWSMEILALIEAHCRFVAAQMPRAAQGCRIALAVLLAIPGACARHLPDVAGTRTQFFEALVRYGLLPALPSRHTQTGALRLLGTLTPLVEARSERHWVLWLAQALDPASPIAERIAAGTPDSQRAVRDPGEVFSPMRSRDYTRDRVELQQKAAAATKARMDAEREAAELHAALAQAEDEALAVRTERDSLAPQVEDLERRNLGLESERTTLKASLASAQERVAALRQERTAVGQERDTAKRTVDGLQGQVGQLRRDLAAMQAARDKANEEAATRQSELKIARADAAALQTRLDTTTKDLATERAVKGKAEEEAAARRAELSVKNHLQARVDLAEKDLKAARAERDAALGLVADHRAQRDQARGALADARERITELEEDVVVQADKRAAAQQETGAARKTCAELEAKIKEATAERGTYENRLSALTQERDRLRQTLTEESKAKHAAVEQQARLSRDLAVVRGERDAANEKIEVARDRLRRQTAEIAVRQLRAPLSAEIIAREVEVLLGRSRG